jgi:hypothetical protein
MNADHGLRFLVARQDLRRTRYTADPHAPGELPLSEGQARLRVAQFALTSNNITYAAFGEVMKYWQFFPCDDSGWGCIPVWGFADVVESRAEGVTVGRRLYGYFPMGTHLVVQPARTNARGFVDGTAHRAELPAVYNQLVFCDADPAYRPELEAQQAVLKPLYITSFLIDDFLADAGFFGARQVLLSSASSKTAYGTAFCLARRRETSGVRLVGLTSPANEAFTRSLGCYDEVRTYSGACELPGDMRTVYVDFAGDAPLRRKVHEHFGDRLTYSCSVGGTHWQDLGAAGSLPGPRPTLFFAPAQVKKRLAAPPDGWGAEGLQMRIDEAWRAFLGPVCRREDPWLRIVEAKGIDAAEAAYRSLLEGQVDARSGLMLSL